MKKNNLKVIILSLVLGLTTQLHSQDFATLKSTIKFWVGSGTDSSALVVTFNSSSFDSSFVWGILFDDSISGSEILDIVAGNDPNFGWAGNGSFLDSVSYNDKSGKNGTDNFWWGIFSQTETGWVSNSGLVEIVKSGDVYGLSFTDYDTIDYSPNRLPAFPIPALNPYILTKSDWDDDTLRWFGEGNSYAILVVDFTPVVDGKSYAFGIKFDDSTTGLGLLEKVAELDSTFRINESGFLNDIIYQSDSGIGGNPNYWGTWSATNFGNWSMNSGISQKVLNGDLVACTYTNFAPPARPTYPQIVEAPEEDNIGVQALIKDLPIRIYPNPMKNILNISLENEFQVEIRNTIGQLVFSSTALDNLQIDSQSWSTGVYFVSITSPFGRATSKVIKN